MARKELIYGLLQSLPILALANADFNGTFLDNCMDFDLTQVKEYTPTFDFTPSFPLNFTSSSEDDQENLRPFGAFKSDWSRLSLLHDALPEGSTLKNKFKHLFRLLLIAHELVTKSSLPAENQSEFRDSVTGETTESFSTEEKNNRQKIYKQTPMIDSEEYLSSISPSQDARKNLELLTTITTSRDSNFHDFDTITSSSVSMLENFVTSSILDTKDGMDSAMMVNTSESTTLDYEDEKTRASTVPDTKSGLMNSSKIFEDSIPTVDMSDLSSKTSLNTQINITATTALTGPHETSTDKKTSTPISATISNEGIISNTSHENVSFIPDEFLSTVSILQSTTIENGTNSSDRASQEIFELTSSNFTASTGSILSVEFEQPSSGVENSSAGTISDFLSTKAQTLPSTPDQKLLTSIKMAADNTLWTPSSTTEIPVNYFVKSDSLESSTTERVPTSTMVSVENSSGLHSSIITNLEKRPSTPEEYLTTQTFINSPTTQRASITTLSEALSISRDRQLNSTSLTPFSTSEEYSSTPTFINSPTTQRASITTPSEALSISRDRQLDSTSLTPFSTPEEDSSTPTFINSPTTQSVVITTPIEEVSISRELELEKSFLTSFSTAEEYSSTPKFLNFSTTQRAPITIPSEVLSVSRDQKLDSTSLTTFSTPEEDSSTTTFINSPTTQSVVITTPSEEVSISRELELEKTFLTSFSTAEDYFSEETFTKSPTTPSIPITTPNGEFSSSINGKSEKTSWTPFTTPEEYSSEEIIVYSTATDGQAPITTMSNDNSELTNQESDKTLWINSSTSADPMKELTNTESPIWISTVTLQFSEQEESLSNETETQSTLKVASPSDARASRIEESWTTSISPRTNSSEDLSRPISSTENDEIKTSYNDRSNILMQTLSNNKSNVFTSNLEISTISRNLVGPTEQADFPDETTKYFNEPTTITTLEKSTGTLTGSTYTNESEMSESGILRNYSTSESRKNETGSTTQNINNDKSAITEQIETSYYLETSTIKAKPNYVKNPLHHSPSRNNNIFRDYKHDSDDTGSERNAESPQIVLYESGAGSRNRSVWRPHLARQPPAGNNIWRFDTFPKNVNPSGHQRPSTSMETTNANVRQETESWTKWPFHGRTNVLRSRKRGSANGNVEKQFIWFYRQAGQSEDRDKSRNKENDDTKIKIQCNNS